MITPEPTPSQTRASLQGAVDAASPGGEIILGAGVYELSGPLRLARGVTLRSAVNGDAVLSGGRCLTLDWQSHAAGIMRAALPEDLDLEAVAFDQLYVDGRRLHLARYPNHRADQACYGGTAEDALSAERVAAWKNPAGGFVHALHQAKWGGDHWRILGKQADGTLDLEGGWMNNRPSGVHPELRFVENIFEELDAPGEWFVDREQRVLYVYPPDGVDLASAEVVVSAIACLVEVIGGSPGVPSTGGGLEGLTLAYTARTFMKTGEPLLRSDWMIHRGGAVYLENAHDFAVEGCLLHRLGGNGVFVSGHARGVSVRGCHLHDVGASGVCFVGKPEAVRSPSFRYEQFVDADALDTTPGPQTEDYPRDCGVDDCLIHDLGTVEKQVAGVQISMAARISVRQVSIYDVPRAGINVSEGTWGGHLIEGCDVFDTVRMTGDHGSFNGWGRDRFWHPTRNVMDRLVAERPELTQLDAIETTVIRNSRWRCDHGWDIDLDDGCSNYTIYNNLCLNGGIKLREGFGRQVFNNIMINNSFHPHVWFPESRDVFERNIVTTWYKPIRVQGWGERIDHNLLPNNDALRRSHGAGLDAHGRAGDPGFVDAAAGDFRVSDASPALKLGFENFPMDRFGVQKPALRAIARTPVIPALRGPDTSESGAVRMGVFLGAQVHQLKGLSDRSATGMDRDRGVLVVDVPTDSVAHDLGFSTNDVILEINGCVTDRLEDVKPAFLQAETDQAAVRISRDQQRQTIYVETGRAE